MSVRLLSLLTIVAILVGTAGASLAAPASATTPAPAAAQAPVSIVINGVKVAADVAPTIVQDRVMVPARVIAETLGGGVEWLPEQQTVLVHNFAQSDTLALKIGSLEYRTLFGEGGEQRKFDVAPLILSGRTLVSVRLLVTFLGASVSWSNSTRTVTVDGPTYTGVKIVTPSMATFASRFGAQPVVPIIAPVFSTPVPVAEGKTAILGKPQVSAEVAAAWARSKGATEQFIALAPLYWSRAHLEDAARADVAYAQAAKETGFGKFGGVIDATFQNPCGLKTVSGNTGTDNIAAAHQRFASWKEGVEAHLDHLELYAGRQGTPYPVTPDPRHFASLKGRAPYVEDLGGKWAPSLTYGHEIMKNGVNQMIEFAKTYSGK